MQEINVTCLIVLFLSCHFSFFIKKVVQPIKNKVKESVNKYMETAKLRLIDLSKKCPCISHSMEFVHPQLNMSYISHRPMISSIEPMGMAYFAEDIAASFF